MPEAATTSLSVASTSFGSLPNGPYEGQAAELWTLSNGVLHASFTNYGARLVSLQAPDGDGKLAHVVLGYESLDDYVRDKTYAGAVVGRFANRLAHGRFTLDGEEYQVPQNDGSNALHGGKVGFDKHLWKATPTPLGIEFTLESPDGDQGFPGALNVHVRYSFDGPVLRLDYVARSEAATVVNLTNHAYFNLSGELAETILDHVITIPATSYTPVTEALVPTGEVATVSGTPFNLTEPTRVGEHIDEDNEQLQFTGGYDHNWVYGAAGEMKLAATVTEPLTKRTLAVHTTEPGLQFYSGNFIDGTMPARAGGVYPRRAGLCLETQHYPDSPNQPEFPSTVLRPGETFRSTTTFTFGNAS